MDTRFCFEVLEKVRAQAPLVHNITNYVVMNSTANALLAVGASPIMAHAEEEVADMVAISNALVVNMGTLSPKWVSAMEIAIQTAKALRKPFVFDPVGAGASAYRNDTVSKLLAVNNPQVLRGNASEIIAVADQQSKTKGVDSTHSVEDALSMAQQLQKNMGSIICISGKTDYVIGKDRLAKIENGHPMMARVTGMGCTATALIGACIGVHEDYFEATVAAMAFIGVAGEIAAENAQGPGSLQLNLYDTLYKLDDHSLAQRINVFVNQL